ncbi:mechanosensitive ion channel family protein [Neolewinella agarilytica]|uniref:mechanosensitive ion channel family protein n=1 Tax=Neolewinella agarilytica TaxID=478744 RepID=UPI0023550B7E|nr:mechanosensitive ion channel domain-containing protein [Neolewinella agarilytica]
MERLRDINLFELEMMSVNLYQVVLIALALLGVFVLGWLLLEKLLPLYFHRETTSEQNHGRTRRVIRFVLVSFFLMSVLRILEIDFTFFDGIIQRDYNCDDCPPVYFTVRISTIVKALVAFIIANVLDLILEEFLTQRYHRSGQVSSTTGGATAQPIAGDRFKSARPLMYTLALLFVAQDTGAAKFVFHKFNEGLSGEVALTLGRILYAIAIFFVVKLVLNIFTTLIMRSYYSRSKIDSGSQFAINRLLTYFAYLIGVLLVIQAAGFNLVVIWTGAAALLVGIGIGLQQTFNDLICGVIILFERSVKVGDVVELSGHQVGTVRKIGTRTSVLETRDDIIIFVPNSKLIGENVTNWSQVERKARFHVKVGVAYGSDTELVKNLLLEVAKDHPRVLDSPRPIVRLLDFGDSSLDFDLIFWTRDFVRVEDTRSDLRFAIDAAFRARKVEIPFPQRDVWMRSPTREEELPEEG